eukprot:4133129-Pleurochrysis_carterae.AAC.1
MSYHTLFTQHVTGLVLAPATHYASFRYSADQDSECLAVMSARAAPVLAQSLRRKQAGARVRKHAPYIWMRAFLCTCYGRHALLADVVFTEGSVANQQARKSARIVAAANIYPYLSPLQARAPRMRSRLRCRNGERVCSLASLDASPVR